MKRLTSVLAVVALTLALLVAGGHPAHAYGKLAVWQIGLSFNCNNPALCQSLGGFWGWAEFDSDNTADAQLTGCQHLQGGRAGGAMHISAEADGWYIAAGSAGPRTFFVVSETDTITGTGGPPFTVTFTNENMDTGIPAVAGHYSAQTIFGTSAPPGTNFEIQVVQIPGR
ncbi:MAG: hypothetical protein E6J52_02645 [Chloroflexi bacterium]|nr:MAG: hypothetical protein E6J52_02645 [Chloroflexota bacterium]